jgi:hypothetical protein
LERVGLQIDQDTQQPILGRGQGTVQVGGVPAGGARLSIQAPLGHLRLEGGFTGRDHLLKFLQGEAGSIQHFHRAGRDVGEPETSHGSGLLSSEAQDTINRDEL